MRKSPPPPPKRPQSPRSPRSRSPRSHGSSGSGRQTYDFAAVHPAESFARSRPVSARRWKLKSREETVSGNQSAVLRPSSARPAAPRSRLGHRARTYHTRRVMASDNVAERPATARAQLPGGAAAPPRMASAFAWAQSPLDLLAKNGSGRRASVLDAWSGKKSEEGKEAADSTPGLKAWSDWTQARQRSEAATFAWELKRAEKAAKKVTELFPKRKDHAVAAAAASAGTKGKGKPGRPAASSKSAKAAIPEKVSAKEKSRRLKALEAARARLAKYDERAAELEAAPPVDDTLVAVAACSSRQGEQLLAALPATTLAFNDPDEELRWEAGLVPRSEVRPPPQSAPLRQMGAKRRDLLASHVRRVRHRQEEEQDPEQEQGAAAQIGMVPQQRQDEATMAGALAAAGAVEGQSEEAQGGAQTPGNGEGASAGDGKGQVQILKGDSAAVTRPHSASRPPSAVGARAPAHRVTKAVVRQQLQRRFALGKGVGDARAGKDRPVPALLLSQSRRAGATTRSVRPSSAMPRRSGRPSDTFGLGLGLTGATSRPATARDNFSRVRLSSTAQSTDFAPRGRSAGGQSAEAREAKRKARQLGLMHFVPGVSGVRAGVDTVDGDALEHTGGFAGDGTAVVPDEDVWWAMAKWKEGRRKEIVRARNNATMARAVARHVTATRRREETLDRRRRQQLAPAVARLRGVGMTLGGSQTAAGAVSVRTALAPSPGARVATSQGRRSKQERQADDEEALTRLLDGADRDGHQEEAEEESRRGGLEAGRDDSSNGLEGEKGTEINRIGAGARVGASPSAHRRLRVPVVIDSPQKRKGGAGGPEGQSKGGTSGYFHFGNPVASGALASAMPRIAPRRSGVIGRGNTGPASPEDAGGRSAATGGFQPTNTADGHEPANGGDDSAPQEQRDPLLGPGPSKEEEAELEEATDAITAAFEAKGLEVLAPSREAIRRGLLLRGGAVEVERDALAAMAVDTTQVSKIAPRGPWDELGRAEVAAAARRKGPLATAGTTVGEHAHQAGALASRSPEQSTMGGTTATRGTGGQGVVGFSGVRWTPADRTQLLVGGPEPSKTTALKEKGKGKGKSGTARSKGKATGKRSGGKGKAKGGKEAPAAALPPPAPSIPGLVRTGATLLPGSLLPGRDIPSHPLPEMRDAVFKKKGGKKKKGKRRRK